MNPKRPRRRMSYLGWSSHGRIVARLLVLWGIYHLTLWQVLCIREYLQQLSANPDQRISLADFFAAFAREHSWMAVYAIAFASLIIWQALSLTHRIIGPLKRVERALYALMDGQSVNSINFREGDLIADFEKAFNAYLSFLRTSKGNAAPTTAEWKPAPAESPTMPQRIGDGGEAALPEQHLEDLLQQFRAATESAQLSATPNSR
jgi:hypothetical protein